MDLLQLEVAQAFQASQEVQEAEARMLRRSMRWGALETWRMSESMGDGTCWGCWGWEIRFGRDGNRWQ